jgi:hypothetical protein
MVNDSLNLKFAFFNFFSSPPSLYSSDPSKLTQIPKILRSSSPANHRGRKKERGSCRWILRSKGTCSTRVQKHGSVEDSGQLSRFLQSLYGRTYTYNIRSILCMATRFPRTLPVCSHNFPKATRARCSRITRNQASFQ